MTQVRVLHLITRMIVGGAQENTLYTVARLDATRFQADLACGPQTGSEGSLLEEARTAGVRLTVLPHLVRPIHPFLDGLALFELVRFLRRGGYTIVHTHSSKAGLLGRLAARLAGVPIIIHTVHGWSFHDYMSPALRRLYIVLERWCASWSDALVTVSQADIRKGLAAGIGAAERYHLIRSAIPLEAFDPSLYDRLEVRRSLGLPPEAPVVGNVGRFSPQKNPLAWVQVAARIAQERPQVHFLLVGDGPLRPQVEEHLARHGLMGRTVLTGLRRDVPRLLAAMDLFLLTSLWEGLPRVVPQALAMRLPLVAFGVDGLVEAVPEGECGYLLPPGDKNGLAQRCVALLDDPDRRRALGERGRCLALAHYDLRQMITRLEVLYEGLLHSKGLSGKRG